MARYINPRIAVMQQLNPLVQADFFTLIRHLERGYLNGETKTEFKVFETYRTPGRQVEAFEQKVSKARAFQSPHQYGLAVDFVPMVNRHSAGGVKRVWSWHDELDWDYLDTCVDRVPCLSRSISWDRPHVEHELWGEIRDSVLGR